ncbi:MAG: PD40 domain-containing protein, partial [Theionarchaea archaeon]|nr:PD40 domain-containing protein [Theionarchaea archaeon]
VQRMFCGRCGSQLEDKALFCPMCGMRIEQEAPPGGATPGGSAQPVGGTVAMPITPSTAQTQQVAFPPPASTSPIPGGQAQPYAPATPGSPHYEGPARAAPAAAWTGPQPRAHPQGPAPSAVMPPSPPPQRPPRAPLSSRGKKMIAVGAIIIAAVVVLAIFYPTISSNLGGGNGDSKLPKAPEGLSVQSGAASNVLTWNPVPDAIGYRVYWSNSPDISKEEAASVEVNNTTYEHTSLVVGQSYYYMVTAIGSKGEGKISTTVAGTPRRPVLSGVAIPPDLDYSYDSGLPCDGLKGIYLREFGDVGWDPIGTDEDSDPSFSFEVDMGKNYELIAMYNGGQIITAITPKIDGDMKVDITFDSEVAANLIYATEYRGGEFDASRLSRDIDLLLADANEAVARLNRFRKLDESGNLTADRITDAVRSLTLNKLNHGTCAVVEDFTEASVRAFGGGLGGIRPLTDIIDDPLPPMIPYVLFSRYNSKEELDFGLSDLEAKRWDYIGSWGYMPHMAVGGNKVVCIMPVSYDDSTDRVFWGVKIRTLGSEDEWKRLTPETMDCRNPCISPDQTRIVFAGRDISGTVGDPDPLPLYNLYVMNTDGSNRRQITFDSGEWSIYLKEPRGCIEPSWSPDGSKIVFTTAEVDEEAASEGTIEMEDNLELIDPDGSNRMILFKGSMTSWRWPIGAKYSPDGERIVFTAQSEEDENLEILVIPADFDIDTNPYYYRMTDNDCDDYFPSFSHTGRYLLYSSDRGGEMGYINGSPRDMNPFYLTNRWTGEVVTPFGNFAEAGMYYCPVLIGICFILTGKEDVVLDSAGNVVIDEGETDERQTDQHSDGGVYYSTSSANSYYREIIPAANSLGISFGCTSW